MRNAACTNVLEFIKQTQIPQTHMRTGPTNNNMVVNQYSDPLRSVGDIQRDFYIGARRHRIAGRMIMHENHRRGAKLQRAFDHLTNINRCVIDGSPPLPFMLKQAILTIEKENMEFL